MTEHQPVILTADEIRIIEARAHELRAQAMAEALRVVGRSLSAAFHKISTLLHRPRAA
ncbi:MULTISPECIES: RSP_7527 family protein [unclassified Pseudophaeobacter]|uniref:RSP_7527 family protein n=1 Tax=unclassified Pseudophaeobacter TaxID=2637024 RepID=UPI0013C4BCA2|nr:hypothetical protein [Pseudophaeobacter sp. EL27]